MAQYDDDSIFQKMIGISLNVTCSELMIIFIFLCMKTNKHQEHHALYIFFPLNFFFLNSNLHMKEQYKGEKSPLCDHLCCVF